MESQIARCNAEKTNSNLAEMHGSQNFKTGGSPSTSMSSCAQGTHVLVEFLGGGIKDCQLGVLDNCYLAISTLVHLTAEVLSEEPILKWYKDAHLAKGKSVFLEQMKKFVEWLKNAEEGNQTSQTLPFHFGMLGVRVLCFVGWGC